MKKPQYLDISEMGESGIRITWVDDIFDNDNLPDGFQIPFRWLEKIYLDDSGAQNTAIDYELLQAIHSLCKELKIGFRVANFEYLECEDNIPLDDGEYILLDIQYTGLQPEDVALAYGIALAKRISLPEDRYKYFSGENNAIGIAFKREYSPIAKIKNSAVKAIREWVEGIIEPTVIHPDPHVSDAVSFYGSVFEENGGNWTGGWDHDGLEANGSEQRGKIQDWLGLDGLDADSAKALFVHGNIVGEPPFTWENNTDEYRKTRLVTATVLKALFAKLNIKIENAADIKDEWKYYVPCQPGLAFWVAVRNLIFQLGRKSPDGEGKVWFHRVTKQAACLSMHILTIQLSDQVKRGDDIVAAGDFTLAKKYAQGEGVHADGNWTRSKNATAALTGVQRAVTTGFNKSWDTPTPPQWAKVFTLGAYLKRADTDISAMKPAKKPPIVSIEFAPRHLHIIWTSDIA